MAFSPPWPSDKDSHDFDTYGVFHLVFFLLFHATIKVMNPTEKTKKQFLARGAFSVLYKAIDDNSN